ncbi:pectate lyase family protein [Streptomyces sp. Inha503]|uniref:pectate lyase family protein n=1 Tax=Streptomyces sp. Inha503 TaxID=3383314 RepID=UPI0039A1CCEC
MTSPTASHRRNRRRPYTVLAGAVVLGGSLLGPQALSEDATAAPAVKAWPDEADGFASLGGGTTGGAAGKTVTVTSFAELEKYATAQDPYVIKVGGTIKYPTMGNEVRVASNKTVIGAGTKGEIVGGGFFLKKGVSNVIIRNLTIRDTRMPDDDPDDDSYDYDAIQIDTADHIWIDHNRLERMNDGLIDSRKDTTNLTVSWNIINENHKTFGIGWTDNVTSQMTIHHNWFSGTQSRNPSIDNVANAHLYNNYLQNTGSGNWSRGKSNTVIENSYFRGVTDPYYKDADAQLVVRDSVVVDSKGKQQTGGGGFDPRKFYDYTLDDAEDVPTILKDGAGPQPDIGN